VTDFGTGADGAGAMAVQADGRIVVGGRIYGSLGLARYLGTCALDTSSATVWTTDGGPGSSRYSSASICRSRRSPRI
jgi:hypothetical protein